MAYVPRPIDTSHVELPRSLVELTELLARHAHDVWARRRLGSGWTLGGERNEATRTHPRLVPYEELPDAEKEYDREAVEETLKAIIALGYRIEKP